VLAHRGRADASGGAHPVSGESSGHGQRRQGRPLTHSRAAADPDQGGAPLSCCQTRLQVNDGVETIVFGRHM
jgi:hypothetical protein